MLDRECIQSRGFRNVVRDGETVGFQVAIRLTYYRGVWLSQLRPATVIVDGTAYTGEDVTWTVAGITCTQQELATHGDLNWDPLVPAMLTIRKPGGLGQGIHDIEVKFTYSASYMPPDMDLLFGNLAVNRRSLVLV